MSAKENNKKIVAGGGNPVPANRPWIEFLSEFYS